MSNCITSNFFEDEEASAAPRMLGGGKNCFTLGRDEERRSGRRDRSAGGEVAKCRRWGSFAGGEAGVAVLRASAINE